MGMAHLKYINMGLWVMQYCLWVVGYGLSFTGKGLAPGSTGHVDIWGMASLNSPAASKYNLMH